MWTSGATWKTLEFNQKTSEQLAGKIWDECDDPTDDFEHGTWLDPKLSMKCAWMNLNPRNNGIGPKPNTQVFEWQGLRNTMMEYVRLPKSTIVQRCATVLPSFPDVFHIAHGFPQICPSKKWRVSRLTYIALPGLSLQSFKGGQWCPLQTHGHQTLRAWKIWMQLTSET